LIFFGNKLAHSNLFVKYYRADLDSQFDLIMLITEHMTEDSLRGYIEQYGFLDEVSTGNFHHLLIM